MAGRGVIVGFGVGEVVGFGVGVDGNLVGCGVELGVGLELGSTIS